MQWALVVELSQDSAYAVDGMDIELLTVMLFGYSNLKKQRLKVKMIEYKMERGNGILQNGKTAEMIKLRMLNRRFGQKTMSSSNNNLIQRNRTQHKYKLGKLL